MLKMSDTEASCIIESTFDQRHSDSKIERSSKVKVKTNARNPLIEVSQNPKTLKVKMRMKTFPMVCQRSKQSCVL
jgi:hypothetical protein